MVREWYDKLKGWKSFIFFGLTLVLGLANLVGFLNYKPTQDEASAIAAFLALAGMLLRKVTDTPMFEG